MRVHASDSKFLFSFRIIREMGQLLFRDGGNSDGDGGWMSVLFEFLRNHDKGWK